METSGGGRWIDLVGGHFFWRILHLCKEYIFFHCGRAGERGNQLFTYLLTPPLAKYIYTFHALGNICRGRENFGFAAIWSSGCAYSSDSETSSAAGVVWR